MGFLSFPFPRATFLTRQFFRGSLDRVLFFPWRFFFFHSRRFVPPPLGSFSCPCFFCCQQGGLGFFSPALLTAGLSIAELRVLAEGLIFAIFPFPIEFLRAVFPVRFPLGFCASFLLGRVEPCRLPEIWIFKRSRAVTFFAVCFFPGSFSRAGSPRRLQFPDKLVFFCNGLLKGGRPPLQARPPPPASATPVPSTLTWPFFQRQSPSGGVEG